MKNKRRKVNFELRAGMPRINLRKVKIILLAGIIIFLTLVFTHREVSAAIINRPWGIAEIGIGAEDFTRGETVTPLEMTFLLDLRLGMRTRFNISTSSSVRYQLYLKRYGKSITEDYNFHILNAILNHGFGELFASELEAEVDFYQQPNSSMSNFQRVSINPELKGYLLDYTTCYLGYSYEIKDYPNYQMDYKSNGISLKVFQEISWSTSLECKAIYRVKDYSETFVLDDLGNPTSEARRDNVTTMKVVLFQSISDNINLQLTYQYQLLDSNANYFEGKLFNHYYNYIENKYGLVLFWNIMKGTFLNIRGSYKDKFYPYQMARDKSGVMLDEKRSDKETSISLSLTYDFLREFRIPRWLKNLELKLEYGYEVNHSNNYLSRHTENNYLLSLMTSF